MNIEIQQYPTDPGLTRYHVRADGIVMASVLAESKSPRLLAEVPERAAEGIIRGGRPWMCGHR